MKTTVLKLKRLKLVTIITIVAVILAVSIDFFIAKVLNHELIIDDVLRATIIPALITPFISWYLVGLLFSIDEMEKKMTVLASFDDLTGLINRRVFFNSSQDLHNTSKTNLTNYCVAIVDLDFFKQLNDNFGHSTGDKVLEDFGVKCNEILTEGLLIGRIGGEEFGLFFPETSAYEAKIFSEKLQNIIRESCLVYQNTRINYTISIGISENEENENMSMNDAFNQADSALYTAKAKGRNQVIVFQKSR